MRLRGVGRLKKSLIAGVGHRFWRDLSVGPVWFDRLAALAWPENVVVEDFGFGAIAMAQRLEADPCERIVFVAAEVRHHPPATMRLDHHHKQDLAPELVQAYITEAGAGVVAVDPLLAIAQYFDALPAETWILEVEPVDTGWGDGLSPQVESLYPRALELLRSFAQGGPVRPVEIAYDA